MEYRRLADLGGITLAGAPADFGKLIPDETEKRAKVIRAANLHLPAEQIGNRGSSAAVRHEDDVDAGHHLEQVTRDMLWAPDGARPHVELAGIGFGISDKLGSGFGGK